MSFFKKLFGGGKGSRLTEMNDHEFRNYVIDAIKNHTPGTKADPDPDDVRGINFETDDGESGRMSIHNLINHVRAYPEEDAQTVVGNFVNGMIYARTTETDLNDANIVVVLRPEEYVAHVNGLNEDGSVLPTRLYLADLHAVYMEDSPDAMRSLYSDDFGDRTLEEIHALAVENVRPWFSNIVGQEAEGVFCMYTIEENSFLISSMVFLDEFWKLLEERHGDHFLFAIPRKDQFFVFNADNPDAMDVATNIIQVTWEDDFNLMSPLIYVRSKGQNGIFKAS